MVLKYIDFEFHYPIGKVLIADPPRWNWNRPKNKQRRITTRGGAGSGRTDDFNAFSFIYTYIYTRPQKGGDENNTLSSPVFYD